MSLEQSRHGLLFALGVYGLWGIAPVYFKWLAHVGAGEIVAHRIVWSLLSFILIWLALVVFTWDSYRWSRLYRQALAEPAITKE